MKPVLSISILVAAIAIYGYCLPRWIDKRFYTVSNLGFGLLTVGFAAIVGTSRRNLGFLVNEWSVIITVVLLIVLALFITSVIIARHKKLSSLQYGELFVRIPFGTALSEELIFRSSLMGILLQSYNRLTAIIVSSVIFGFWHVIPSQLNTWAHQNILFKNISVRQAKTLSGSMTVAFTALGGMVFGWLRVASGGILLPWTLHTFTNAGGWIVSFNDMAGKSGKSKQ
jgi:membrane protease YdiL (CAAX protease family)